MAYDESDKNRVNVLPFGLCISLIIFLCIFGVGTGIAGIVSSVSTTDDLRRYNQASQRDLFFESVAAKKADDLLKPSAKQLFADLTTFQSLNATEPSSVFAPNSLNNIILPAGRYPDLKSEMGQIAFNDGASANYGNLGNDFINDYLAAEKGALGGILENPINPDRTLHVFINDFSFLTCLGIIWLFMNIWVLVLMFFLTDPGIGYWKWDIRNPHYWTGFIFAPITYLILLPWAIATPRKIIQEKKEADRLVFVKRLEQERKAKNHPLAKDLENAQKTEKNLQALLLTYPKDEKLKTALKICQAVIKELEQFPDKMSLQSSQFLADQMITDLQLTNEKMQALLSARKEVEI